MRSPRAGGRALRRRARRPPARAGQAPAPLVDGPPLPELHRDWRRSSSKAGSAGGKAAGARPEDRVRLRRPLGYGKRMARLVGINHVALEVGDIEEALAWYGRF